MRAYVFMGLCLGLIEPAFSQNLQCNLLPQSPQDAKMCIFENILWDTSLYSSLNIKGMTGNLENCTFTSGRESYFTDIADVFELKAQEVKEKNIRCRPNSENSLYVCTLKGIPGCFIADNQNGMMTTRSQIAIDVESGSVIGMWPLEPDENEFT